ncbi:hypothetical protein QYE76_022935 [Lolium multiflorum]|uniref:CCHC-type domain-containing protein n=1 Tax=Lolium multiflorum TaxID=4521 RepID=A0AAD8VUK7_LOLMU|nr:hypothetical protein QYE76_022935 [Lolium multiflorum]
MEDHVELDTDNGSASIGDMTDIEHLYTDHDSPSMDNMVDHHSELDHNNDTMMEHRTEHYLDYDYDTMMEHRTEHYLDYDYDTMMEHRTEHYLDYDYDTMMEHRTEHYLDYDIDTMVEPSFNTTLHKTDGATMRVLPHMIIYIELVLWNNKSVPAMIAIDTLLRAQEGTTSKVPSYMNHHLGMLRIVIDTRHLKIVVDHHHLMIAIDMRHHMIIADTSHLIFAIDMRHHMIIADTSHLMFAIDQHLPRIFDDTPQDMVMMQEDESLDMKRPRLQRKMVASAHKEEPPIMVLSPTTATTTMAPTRSSSPKMKTVESTLQEEGRSTQLYANMTMICPPRPRSSQCFRCTQDGHHLWECPNLHCDVCTSNKHMTWECNTPQAHKLYFAQLDAQFANKTLQDTIIFKEWCKEMDKMTTMKPILQDGAREGQDKSDVDSSLALNNTIAPSNGVHMGGDGVENGEHGMIPSPMEANGVENGEHGILPSPTEAHGVEMVEHGKFPSTTEAHGDEQVEPTPTCLIDELVPTPCEHESHLAHLSESDSELSDFHPICEFECFHLEDMSDTPSSMEDEFPIMEKMYMVHEDDAITPCLLEDEHGGHMEPTTSTTPTSNESDYKGLLTSEGTFKRWCHLPPLHIHEELSSRTTLFQVGGDDAARPSVYTASYTSSPREDAMETRGRKADVTEAWKRRRKRSWTLQAGTSAPDGRNFRPQGPELPPPRTGTSAKMPSSAQRNGASRNFRPDGPELPPTRNFRPSSAQAPKVHQNAPGCYCKEMGHFRNLAGTWPELPARPELPPPRTGTSARGPELPPLRTGTSATANFSTTALFSV